MAGKLAKKAAPSRGAKRSLDASGPLFDPVGRSLDLIGERWTLILVSHLLGAPRHDNRLGTQGVAPFTDDQDPTARWTISR